MNRLPRPHETHSRSPLRAGLFVGAAALSLAVLAVCADAASACHIRRSRCPVVEVEPCCPSNVVIDSSVPPLMDKPASDKPPADKPPADKPPADKPPSDKPPADKPPSDKPPADKPPAALEMQEFSSDAGRFTVQMPGKPKEQKQTVNQIDNYAYSVAPSKDVVFLVSYFDLPPTVVLTLDASVNAYAGGRKGQASNIKSVTLNDEFPGKEAEVALPNGSVSRIRIFQVKQRQYQLVVDGSKDVVHSADADKFFSSFHLKGQ